MSLPPRNRRAGRMTGQNEAAPRPVPPADPLPQEDAAPDVMSEAPIPPARDLLATNTGVRLACTMAAMMGLFALFLCWAEKESRVIRRFSVQSACLTALHALAALAALLLSALMGGIPYFGLVVTLLCLLAYMAALVLLVVVRVQLMRHAWEGVRFMLPPALEKIISRFY